MNAATLLAAPVANLDPVDTAIDQRSLLRMSSGEETVAVPIEQVREILEVGRLTPLPRTPDFVRGVMNLRGAVVPVVDLSARIGKGNTAIGRRSCIVVVEAPGSGDDEDTSAEHHAPLIVGLLVDAVYEVFDTDAAAIEPVPMLGTRIAAAYLNGMARARGVVVAVLDLPHLLSVRDLAQAIAAHQPA